MVNERRCENCTRECPKAKTIREIAEGRMYAVQAFIDLQRKIENGTLVEVIHCKDCKHMEITPDNLRWCNAWNSINGMGDEGYCNYGKRKSGTQPQREDT